MRLHTILLSTGLLMAYASVGQQTQKQNDTTLLQNIEINAVRASAHAPVSQTLVTSKTIKERNSGYDMPFILNLTPSVQVNSDAGNGIGYTGIRIRGTDATRVNITLNGIPYNDAESQGTYWVNLPDIATSANSIQIQRGVGTSANGTGAFGGSVNINTNDIDTVKQLNAALSYGSFRSHREAISYNSGLLHHHLILTGRVSQIGSDGYVERAQSKLRSFFTSAVWVNQKESFRVNVFSGKEKTYAAWFGIDANTLDTNRRYNPAGTEKSGSPYDNESDNYWQTHYQAFYNRKINNKLKLNITGFMTRGKGYFEQYKSLQDLSAYGLSPYILGNDTTYQTDLIRQLWLDNYFYGGLFSLHYQQGRNEVITGLNWNQYDGLHYGKIISAAFAGSIPTNYEWYRHDAHKKEISGYVKWNAKIAKHWYTYIDMQLRNVQYRINGFKDNPTITVDKKYTFFNPKAGLTYENKHFKYYLSYARAVKEPNRDDFEAGINETPRPEILNDFETGLEKKSNNYSWGLNLYYMGYKDQLVLTGKVNQVYAYTRTNIPSSYRLGLEMDGQYLFNQWLSVGGNLTISSNKVKYFTEYIDDYDLGGQQIKKYSSTDLSFSPSVIGAGLVKIVPAKGWTIELTGKYIGKQYLDNTSNENRKLKDYFTQDAKLSYVTSLKSKTDATFFVQANNIFSKKYVANGYTFSYLSGGNFTTENYYYPMATINIMCGINIEIGKK